MPKKESNIEKTVNSIRLAVEEAEAKSGVDINVVNVGIAGQHIKSLQHRGSKIRNLIEEEISQSDIDSLIDDMYKLVMKQIVDYFGQMDMFVMNLIMNSNGIN